MSGLPSGWVAAAIGSLCSLKNGRAFKPTEWTIKGLPIVRIQNLNNPQASYNYFAGEFADRYHLRGGELLFAWSGTPGTSFGAHVWRGGQAVLNQHIFRIDFNETEIDKTFFRFAINQKLNELIDIAHGGVGLRHVTKGKFESTEIALAPLDEQKRIADKLEVLLARVDTCSARLDRIRATFKRFRQSVLVAATTGNLSKEWRETRVNREPWRQSEVQSVAKVGTGSTPLRSNPTYFASKGTPWITSAATSQPIVYSAQEFVTDAAIAAHRLKKFPAGTILVAMYGEGKTRGQVTELGIEATINQACAAVVVDENLATKEFVKLALQANYLKMRDLAEGGNQPNLNLSKIKSFRLWLPQLDEQTEIVSRVGALFALADRLELRYIAARAQVERLTSATLAKAFRGELVPQTAREEPASLLLERFQAKRDDHAAGKPKRHRMVES